jgi:hypothetical protein
MAQSITITIQDDAKAIKLLNYFCKRFGYQDTIANPDFNSELAEDPVTNPTTIDNPESKKDYLKRYTIRWWREEAKHGMRKENESTIEADFDEGTIIID